MLLLTGFYLTHKFNVNADWILLGLFILDYNIINSLVGLFNRKGPRL